MKLYNYWRSSCSWRVRIALSYKNIPYEYIAVHLLRDGGEQFKEPHRDRNPLGQVPVLEISQNGEPHYLSQSMAILEYLEEQHPLPALLPKDPLLRAEARRQSEAINSGIQPYQGLTVGKKIEALGGNKAEWNQFWIISGLTALEAMVRKTHKTYCIGGQVTFADCFLIPQLFAARRFSVNVDTFPTLLKVEKNCLELPAFQVSHPDRQPDTER